MPLDEIEIDLRDRSSDHTLTIYVTAHDNSLSRRWLTALNQVLEDQLILEKNYCFFGFPEAPRDGWYILDQVNRSIQAINQADLGYHIDDHFTMEDCLTDDPVDARVAGRNIRHDRFNWLHRYFEDLQGTSGNISPFYQRADVKTRWHIRQLNLLCHEFESWALSYRKQIEAPDWQRPSQLMCWLRAPRFELAYEDYELFGIETINRDIGGLYMGVNKAVGKHHWEVFCDEGKDSRVDELVSTSLRSQTEGSADFDIEWGRNPAGFEWQARKLAEFRTWLSANGFDPDDKALTIGHPQIGQVDLRRSFASEDFRAIWACLNSHLDVVRVATSDAVCRYDYHWSDTDFQSRQIQALQGE
jgi:hypothetical protein